MNSAICPASCFCLPCLYPSGWLSAHLAGSLFISICLSGSLSNSLFLSICLSVWLAGSVSIRLSVGLAGWLCLYSSACWSGWLVLSVLLSLSHSTTVSYSHLSGVFNADTRYAVSHLNKFVLVFFCFLTRREMRVPFDEEMIHFFILFRMTE